MDRLELLKERRSIHTFQRELIPENILEKIFTYASFAPTHYMKEPWELKLFQKEGKEKFITKVIESYQRIGMIAGNQDKKTLQTIQSISAFLREIPHHVLIYFEKQKDLVRYEEDYAAVCAFIQNAQVAAWEFGVGMLWTITPYMHDSLFASSLGLDSETFKIAAVLQMGYPKKIPQMKTRTPIQKKWEFIETSF